MTGIGLIPIEDTRSNSADSSNAYRVDQAGQQMAQLISAGCDGVVVALAEGLKTLAVEMQAALGSSKVDIVTCRTSKESDHCGVLRRGLQAVMQRHLSARVVVVPSGVAEQEGFTQTHYEQLLSIVSFGGYDAARIRNRTEICCDEIVAEQCSMAFSKSYVAHFWDATYQRSISEVLNGLAPSRLSDLVCGLPHAHALKRELTPAKSPTLAN